MIEEELVSMGTSLKETVDWINVMFYDVPPSAVGAHGGLTLEHYKVILSFFERFVPKEKVVMGIEPGNQAAGGQWAGMGVSEQVIDYIQRENYGGIMFWAINQGAAAGGELTGENVDILAKYAHSKFGNWS